MKSNGLGFSGGKPSATIPPIAQPSSSTHEPPPEKNCNIDIKTSAPKQINHVAVLNDFVEKHDLPLCNSMADIVCCCCLTIFLVGAIIALVIWYGVASSNL